MLNRNQLIAGIVAVAAFEGCFYEIAAQAATQKVDVNPNKTHLSADAFALTKYIDSIRNNDGMENFIKNQMELRQQDLLI